MKIKVSLKCMNCNLKEESFLFDTENIKTMFFKCSNCKSKWAIKVEEND